MALNWLLSDLAGKFEQANNLIVTATKRALSALERLITNTPYPKSTEGGTTPEIWGEPAGETWAALYNVYYNQIMDYVLIVIGIFLIITYFLRIFDSFLPKGYNPNKTIGDLFKLMGITVFWWPIAVSILVLSAFIAELLLAVSVYSAPDGDAASGLAATYTILDDQISQAFGSGSSLVTSIVLLVPLLLKSFLVIGLICLWIIRYLAIFLLTPVLPVLLLLSTIDLPKLDYIGSLGDKAVKAYVSLIFLSLPAALVITMFSVVANSLTPLIEGTVTGDSGSATMILADGAGVANNGDEFIAAIMLTLVGIAFAMAMPLVAAGGPFAFVYASQNGGIGSLSGLATGGLSLGDVAKQGSGAAGSIAETGVGVKDRADDARKEAYDMAGIDYGEDIDEDSRFGSIRSRMHDTKSKVDNIREMSATERAVAGGQSGVNAGRRGVEKGRELREDLDDVSDILREQAINAGKTGVETWKNPRTMAKIARENAKNSAQKAFSERDLRNQLEDTRFEEIVEETGESLQGYRESVTESTRNKINQVRDTRQKIEDEFERAGNMTPEEVAEKYSNSPMSDREVEEIESKDENVEKIHGNLVENKEKLENAGVWEQVKNGTMTMEEGLEYAKKGDYQQVLEEDDMMDVYQKSSRQDPEKFYEDWQKRDRLKLSRSDKMELLEEKGALDDWNKDEQTLDEFFKEWRGEARTDIVRKRGSEEAVEALDGDKEDKYNYATRLLGDAEGRDRAEIERFMDQEMEGDSLSQLSEEEFDEFIKEFEDERVVEDIQESYEEALDREAVVEEAQEHIKDVNDHYDSGETTEIMSDVVEHKVREDVGRQVMHEYLVTEQVRQDVREESINQIREMYGDEDQTVDVSSMKEVIQEVRSEKYDDPSDIPDDALGNMDSDEIKDLLDMTGRDVTGSGNYAEEVLDEINTNWSAEDNNERYEEQQRYEEEGTTLTEEDLGRLNATDMPVDELAKEIADGSYEGLQDLLTSSSVQSQVDSSSNEELFDFLDQVDDVEQIKEEIVDEEEQAERKRKEQNAEAVEDIFGGGAQ